MEELINHHTRDYKRNKSMEIQPFSPCYCDH